MRVNSLCIKYKHIYIFIYLSTYNFWETEFSGYIGTAGCSFRLGLRAAVACLRRVRCVFSAEGLGVLTGFRAQNLDSSGVLYVALTQLLGRDL